jgi:bacillithiol biosynthesis cysteine-adding enzyme BshC
LAAPIIIRKLEERGQMNKLLLEQSRALEQEQYEKQILIRSELLNVFILKDNTRIPMTVLGEMLTNGEEKEILSDQELIQLATEYPERFSPKVAFRPIVQDFLFPTVAYIGGPSELTYFAQLKKIYEFFEIQMPIIWPRITATLIDAKIKRLMQKVGIDVKEIFREEEEVIQNILGKYSPLKPEGVFSEAGKRLDEVIDWLEGKLTQLDPSLSGQFKSSYSKMHYQVNSMKIRTFNQLKAQHQSVINNWKSLQVLVYPQKKLQDRVYNILYFLSRYGFWLMDYLTENLDINTDDHQILEIPAYSG